jgi:hypothetical protein
MTSFLLDTWTDTLHQAPLSDAVSIRLRNNAYAYLMVYQHKQPPVAREARRGPKTLRDRLQGLKSLFTPAQAYDTGSLLTGAPV